MENLPKDFEQKKLAKASSKASLDKGIIINYYSCNEDMIMDLME